MRQLKLVSALDVGPVREVASVIGFNESAVELVVELERALAGANHDLGARAAKCIRDLVQEKEQATLLMLETSVLLKSALTQLHALRARL